MSFSMQATVNLLLPTSVCDLILSLHLVNETNIIMTCRTSNKFSVAKIMLTEEVEISLSGGHFVFPLTVQVETGLNKMFILQFSWDSLMDQGHPGAIINNMFFHFQKFFKGKLNCCP